MFVSGTNATIKRGETLCQDVDAQHSTNVTTDHTGKDYKTQAKELVAPFGNRIIN